MKELNALEKISIAYAIEQFLCTYNSTKTITRFDSNRTNIQVDIPVVTRKRDVLIMNIILNKEFTTRVIITENSIVMLNKVYSRDNFLREVTIGSI